MAAPKKDTKALPLRIETSVIEQLTRRAKLLGSPSVNAYAADILRASLGHSATGEAEKEQTHAHVERDIDLRSLLIEALKANAEANRTIADANRTIATQAETIRALTSNSDGQGKRRVG